MKNKDIARRWLRLLPLLGLVAGCAGLAGSFGAALAEDTPPPAVAPVAPAAPPTPAPLPLPAADTAPAAPVPAQPVLDAPAPAQAPAAAPAPVVAPAPASPAAPLPAADMPAPAATPIETAPAPIAPAPAVPASDGTIPQPPAPPAAPETPVVLNHHGETPSTYENFEHDRPSLLGSYLAGSVARGQRDQDVAADYFSKALELDPGSDILLEQAFVLELSRGNWDKSNALADEVVKKGDSSRFARMVKGLQAVLDKDYDRAADEFSKSETRSPLGKMIGHIVVAWLDQARGNGAKALAELRKLDSMNWAKFYQDYHTAMLADQAGQGDVAAKVYQRLFEKDPRSLRMMDAYVRHLVVRGQKPKALEMIALYRKRNGEHLLLDDLEKRINAGETLAFIAATPQDGLAELFYGIGDALTGDGGVDLGMIYLQAGLRLRPDLPLASLALAEAFESSSHFEDANRIYDSIDRTSPLWPNAAVRRAFNLNSLEKVNDATKSLDELLATYPNDINALESQGNILRAHKRYGEAVDYYSRAIALLKGRQKQDWKYYYSRGVCYERLKQWPKAEADLEMARSLDADQPLVLNYLGYSWVDQAVHLNTAMRLIRRAVELKPDDGYFVDSLGWAHYRLGNYPKAVEELERAVELKPDDPVINDHLGDVYWRVGRRLEARFQWEQSLTLAPEPEDIPKTRAKLEKGLGEAEPLREVSADNGSNGQVRDAVPAAGGEGAAAGKAGGTGAGDAGSQPVPAKSIGAETRYHIVRGGENPWLIAKRYYGDGRFHTVIERANRLRNTGRGIRLLPGTRLVIPPKPKP